MRCTKCRQEIAPRSGVRGQPVVSTPNKAPADKTATNKTATASTSGSTSDIPGWAFVERPPIDIDTWRWDEDLLEAERIIRARGAAGEPPANRPAEYRPPLPAMLRSDPAHVREPSKLTTKQKPNQKEKLRSPKFAFVSWAALSLGVMALVFGGVLLGWSFWSGDQQLWTLGLPFALGGQAALMLGLVLQLDGLWQSNQDATVVLSDLDEQIDELRHATSLLTTSHSSHAQSFYLHLAEGASPHMLLSDLKGQLDLLAMRMAKDSP